MCECVLYPYTASSQDYWKSWGLQVRLLAGGSFFGSTFTLGFNASADVGTKHVSVMQATLSNEQDRGAEEEGKGLLRYLK